MFERLLGKKEAEIVKVYGALPDEEPSKVEFHVQTGVLHCCCSLSPEAFIKLMGRGRLPFIIWYNALWIIQHTPNIATGDLKDKLGVSWPTAQVIKKRILAMLAQYHGIDYV